MRYKLAAVLLFTASSLWAADDINESSASSTDTTTVKKIKKSPLKAWWDNIAHGNVDRTFERPMDVTFAVSPFYSAETSVGIGGQLSALYRTNRRDSSLHVSDVSLMGGATLNGTYSFGIKGNAHFTHNSRLMYTANFRHQRRDFWGITFDDCDVNPACRTQIDRIQFSGDYQQRIIGNWFWGAALRLAKISSKPDSIGYLRGQDDAGFFTGIGALAQYDSRDFLLNPTKGCYFLLREIFYPHKLGKNPYDIYCTTIQFNAYHKLWRDAILAYDLFSEFNTTDGEVPWQLRQEICVDDRRMRGYVTGSYIDNNQICTQIELRQHIWKRWGAVAWVGAGTMFNVIEEFNMHRILPNYGVGLRFEMKYRTNIRVELGFGKDVSTLVIGFAEAF